MAKGGEIEESVLLDIADVLDHVKDALERLDIDELSEWSNHVLHSMAIYREKRAVYIAILAYSLSKLVDKNKSQFINKQKWNNFIINMLKELVRAAEALEKRNIAKFDELMTLMLKQVADFDKSFSHYVEHVIEFSKVQKGAKIYEHGISLASVAEMLGINQWDLMRKVGELKERPSKHVEFRLTKTPKKRLEELKRISNKK